MNWSSQRRLNREASLFGAKKRGDGDYLLTRSFPGKGLEKHKVEALGEDSVLSYASEDEVCFVYGPGMVPGREASREYPLETKEQVAALLGWVVGEAVANAMKKLPGVTNEAFSFLSPREIFEVGGAAWEGLSDEKRYGVFLKGEEELSVCPSLGFASAIDSFAFGRTSGEANVLSHTGAHHKEHEEVLREDLQGLRG